MTALATALMGLWALAGRVQLPNAGTVPAQIKASEVPAPSPARPEPKVWPGQGEPAIEKARRRILAREAGGNYGAVNASHTCFGGYQFRLRTSDLAARRMQRPDLVGIPASQWSKEDQDAAFYVIYDRGRGKRNWSRGGRRQTHA